MTPAQARALFRTTDAATTAGFSAGYAQANLIAQRNPKACPLLGVLELGQVSSPLLAGGDIRTEIPSYRVYAQGSLIDEPSDATTY